MKITFTLNSMQYGNYELWGCSTEDGVDWRTSFFTSWQGRIASYAFLLQPSLCGSAYRVYPKGLYFHICSTSLKSDIGSKCSFHFVLQSFNLPVKLISPRFSLILVHALNPLRTWKIHEACNLRFCFLVIVHNSPP